MEQLTEQTRWVQIDLAALCYNYEQIRSRLNPQVRLLAVVKGDAYGHGAVEVSRTLERLGADMLGVTTVAEGLLLRREGITMPILVFSPFLPEEAGEIIANDLTASIASLEAITWLGNAAREKRRKGLVHLKVETGMGRTGLWPQQIAEAVKIIQGYTDLQLAGIYTHLATATWQNPSYTQQQFQIFQQVLKDMDELGYAGVVKHIANSAALLKFPQMHLDMVRAGTLLYGQYPSPDLEKQISLQDPWSFHAKVTYLRELPAGHSVGYGRTYTTRRPARVAVLPVGYSDGFQMEPVLRPVNLLELLKGLVKLVLLYLGHSRMDVPVFFPTGRGRVIGKVGMQLTMVDITGLPGVQVGTVASIPLRRTAVNSRVPRVFLDYQNKSANS